MENGKIMLNLLKRAVNFTDSTAPGKFKFGKEIATWGKLLANTIDMMVKSLDSPNSRDVKDF